MNNYDTWINLSDLGKKELGHIFPNGTLPSKWILPENATLEGQTSIVEVYRVDIKMLSNDQFEKIIDYIMSKNKERGLIDVDRNVVVDDIKKLGFIPIQAKYVSGSGTTRTEMFL